MDVAEVIFRKALEHHREFQELWGLWSYHNGEHVGAEVEAGRQTIQKVLAGEDGLGFKEALFEKAEELENGYELSDEEIEELFVIMWATHDLGNLGEWKDGKLVFNTDDQGRVVYRSMGAEERSQEIAAAFIKHFGDEGGWGADKIAAYQRLTEYLIDLTKYEPPVGGTDGPVGFVVRCIDQIVQGEHRGKRLIGELPEEVVGLALEWAIELFPARKSEAFMVNFASQRLAELKERYKDTVPGLEAAIKELELGQVVDRGTDLDQRDMGPRELLAYWVENGKIAGDELEALQNWISGRGYETLDQFLSGSMVGTS